MSNTRILIVDGEAASRNQLRKILIDFGNLEIVGSVSNCRLARQKIPQVNPDIVVLDVDMPDTDVIQTILDIRKSYPDLPVLMLCSHNENKNAARVLEAMAAGANDYLPKVPSSSKKTHAGANFADEILAKIRPFCPSPVKRRKNGSARITKTHLPQEVSAGPSNEQPKNTQPRSNLTNRDKKHYQIDILAIGVSTGGPEALTKLLSGFAYDFPVPIVIVQHMPAEFTGILAARLNTKTALAVSEAQDGDFLLPGKILLAPGGRHMIVRREQGQYRIHTHFGPPENSCRPAADVLFRSIAECYGPHSLLSVLTGMGQDGFLGAQKVKASGGKVMVQDEKSSVVWGMPGALARADLADQILPLEKMSKKISEIVWAGRSYTSSQTPVEFSA